MYLKWHSHGVLCYAPMLPNQISCYCSWISFWNMSYSQKKKKSPSLYSIETKRTSLSSNTEIVCHSVCECGEKLYWINTHPSFFYIQLRSFYMMNHSLDLQMWLSTLRFRVKILTSALGLILQVWKSHTHTHTCACRKNVSFPSKTHLLLNLIHPSVSQTV